MVLPFAPPSVIDCTSSGRSFAALLVQVEPVGGLGEPQVGVDTGDDDAGVDGQELDPDQGDPDEGVDDEALVEDELDDVGEAARAPPGRARRLAAAAALAVS